MENAKVIDIKHGYVIMNNGILKSIDNYVLELEDRLIKIYSILNKYEDVDPNAIYRVKGEELFEVLDILENRK